MTNDEHDPRGPDGPAVDPAVLLAERECLGRAMRYPEDLEVVLGTLEASDYVASRHRALHEVLMERTISGLPCDELAVVEHLAQAPAVPGATGGPRLLEAIGGPAWVHELAWNLGVGPVDRHVEVVEGAARRREIARQAKDLTRLANTPGVSLEQLRGDLLAALEITRRTPGTRWIEPKPLVRAMPALPLAVLPGVVRRFVTAVAATTQTPPDLAAFAALATLSGATRGAWEIRLAGSWVEQTCLYLAALSDSGTRKSAVVKLASAPLRDLEWRDEDVAALARAQADHELLTKRYAAALDRASREDPDGTADDEVRELAEKLAAKGPPTQFQILADDTTAEGLARLMEQQGGPQAMVVDEGGVLGTLAGRYTSNSQANIDLVLRAYDGASVKINRASKPAIRLRRPILAMGLIVQPDVLAEAMKVRAFVQRGLMARFLVCRPTSTVGTRALDAPGMDPAAEAEWAAVVGKIVQESRDLTRGGELRTIRLDAGAQAAFDAWRGPAGHEARLHRDLGDLADMQSWASKLPGALVRIAGLFALAERPGDAHPVITESEMRAALDLTHYLVEHAREVLGGARGDRPERLDEVLVAIKAFLRGGSSANKPITTGAKGTSRDIGPSDDVFTGRDIYRAVNGRAWVSRADDVADVLSELADLGYIRELPPEAPKRGRPPSPRYQAHPRVVTAARRSSR